MHFSLDLDHDRGLGQLVAEPFVLRFELGHFRQRRPATAAVGTTDRGFEQALAVLAAPVGDEARVESRAAQPGLTA